MLLNEYEQIVALTKEWEGERFTDGRPKVSDEKIEILKTLTQEEIWHPLYFSGYRFQFQGNMRALHEDKKLYGRAVTCCFMPQRPDVRRLAFDTARGKGWKGDCNQWVIDSLCEGDVVVCDLYDKIFKGTFVGGNLTTAIHARTKTGGAVVWGGVRDIEQMQKIDAQVYFRGVDPHPFVTAKLQTSTVPAALERHCACPEISLLEPKTVFCSCRATWWISSLKTHTKCRCGICMHSQNCERASIPQQMWTHRCGVSRCCGSCSPSLRQSRRRKNTAA